jgi:hypothetical protein
MRKLLLSIAFVLVMVPCMAGAETVSSPMVAEAYAFSSINIYFSGTTLRITGASGYTLNVYSITGSRVMCQKIDSDDKTWNLNLMHGVYIVKVGNVVRKIAVA